MGKRSSASARTRKDRTPVAAAALEAATTPAASNGRLNIYTCRACRGHVVTRDVDEGVTPMFLDCRATLNCGGTMQSSMYYVFDQTMREDFQWYRPLATEVVSEASKGHVAQGGLLIRQAIFPEAAPVPAAADA